MTPGWVDIHTHYDGQASWDPFLTPSSWHGVTTVVMGNCGVGFAPAAPDRHEWLIELMEGVEDIPGTALTEGLTWDWESFEDYLDALDVRQFVIDVGAQVAQGGAGGHDLAKNGAGQAETLQEVGGPGLFARVIALRGGGDRELAQPGPADCTARDRGAGPGRNQTRQRC